MMLASKNPPDRAPTEQFGRRVALQLWALSCGVAIVHRSGASGRMRMVMAVGESTQPVRSHGKARAGSESRARAML